MLIIRLTSACSPHAAVAFMIGTASSVAVVQVFCYQLVISVIFNFLALFALFIPVMILDCGRVMADRPETCITCCNDQDAYVVAPLMLIRVLPRVLTRLPASVVERTARYLTLLILC